MNILSVENASFAVGHVALLDKTSFQLKEEYIKSKNSMKLIDLKVLDKGIYKVIVYVNSVKTRKSKKNKKEN